MNASKYRDLAPGVNWPAVLAICARAKDKADAVLLLTMCGLLPEVIR